MNSPLGFVLLLVAHAASLAAEPPPAWVQNFDRVWQTIHDKHWDRERSGAPWDEAREKFRPRLLATENEAHARAVVQEMLATLGQSHFGIIPKENYRALAEPGQGSEAEAGVELRILDGAAVVTRVEPGSSAAEAGVKTGWVLASAAGRELAPLLAKQSKLAQWIIATRALRGRAGNERAVVFETGSGATAALTLRFRPSLGRVVRFGNLPPIGMELERRALPSGAQYLRWSAFFEPDWLNTELSKAIAECGACPGLVLDVRGNLGGLAILAATVTGWLVPAQESIGTVLNASGTLKLVSFPRPGAYRGKVALLIDELSISTAEFLAAGLKDLGRARLFGRTTQGAALPSVIEKLPTGDGFQFAVADYVSRSGAKVEGVGVTPHVMIPLLREDLISGRDAVLDAALQWLNEPAGPSRGRP